MIMLKEIQNLMTGLELKYCSSWGFCPFNEWDEKDQAEMKKLLEALKKEKESGNHANISKDIIEYYDNFIGETVGMIMSSITS